MLVKIVAVGLSHALWKNVFHHLRMALPREPFTAGIFSTPEELAYLEREYLPEHWQREAPDLVLCDAPAPAAWEARLAWLRRALAKSAPAPVLGLTLHNLEHGLRHLVQGRQPVTYHLDNGTRFSLNDPRLLIGGFPEGYPRLRVNAHLNALRLKGRRGPGREVRPQSLPDGSLLGFSQLDAVVRQGQPVAPEDWLREVTRAERVRLPARAPVALYREPDGLYLFPGVPVPRVRAVSVGGVTFSPLLDLGMLTDASPGFAGAVRAVREAHGRHGRAIAALTARVRDAESRTDLPVRCAGEVGLLNRTMAALLRRRGYARVTAEEPGGPPPDDAEPGLVLQLSPAEGEPPRSAVVLEAVPELAPRLALLDPLMEWRTLDGQAPAEPLDEAEFVERRDRLAARVRKAEAGLGLARRRRLVLEQEVEVLDAAAERLEALLAPPVQEWQGTAPPGARQALVLSFDNEEAHAVMQALPGIAKKRWYDLSAAREPDTVQGLSLQPVADYGRDGAVLITPDARERLEGWQRRYAADRERQADELEATRAASEGYREELDKVARARRQLALRWVRQCLQAWLDEREASLLEALAELRPRHERHWFQRTRVSRLALVSASGENRAALEEACREVYPHFDPELSAVVPYDYEPLDDLPEEQRGAIMAEGQAAEWPPERLEARLREALERENGERLEHYLQIVTSEVGRLPRLDLVLVEHPPGLAGRLVEHLRETLTTARSAPAVLVLPDTWTPSADRIVPLPHTRTVIIRRMGALTAAACAERLRALYPK